MFWKREPTPTAEIDIEHLSIMSMERCGDETVFRFTDTHIEDDCLRCSLEDHERFVQRLRAKWAAESHNTD